MTTALRLRRALPALSVLLSASLPLAAAQALPAEVPAFKYHGFQGEASGYVPHFDARGQLAPTAAQQQAAAALGATVRFGPNGSPKVITGNGRFLSASSDASPETTARSWLKAQAALFGLSAANIDAMETLRVSPLYESPDFKRMAQGLAPENPQVPHVVLLRQVFAGLPTGGREGLVSITLSKDGRVAFVGSTLTAQQQPTNSRRLAALEALQLGADSVKLPVGALEAVQNSLNDFLTFSSSILDDVQRVRPRMLPTASGLRHVWEVILLDSAHTDDRGHPQAFTLQVDAEDGHIWTRDNAVQHLVGEPAWKIFPNAPNDPLNPDTDPTADTREFWCWNVAEGDADPFDDGEGRSPEECQGPELREMLGRGPWDETHLGVPTFSTRGNNAITAVSNASFISPDTVVLAPVSPTREYDFAWTDAWRSSACDPTAHLNPLLNFNDFEAATANLFAMHNRMHDWSYLLGWTEVNSNLQLHNFGNTPIDRANDPELGSAQAGRLTVNGRDNANQITLADGIPGITNQYLWQSLAGIIYPGACVDGAYDMAIIAHEYTHATTNRMTGGPDGSLGGGQAGNMGEAWSDLAAIEYLQSFGLTPVGRESPFAMSVYATGDPEAGIRNYAIDQSPLNFSNFQYDPNGLTTPHADSEIFGAVQYSLRKTLIEKYQADYPFEDRELQIDCAEGRLSAQVCPGNRRWVQMMFDALLIQPAGPSMLDNRDATLASNLVRFDGADLVELWDAYASRGQGEKAFTIDRSDVNPRPDFSSPMHENEADIVFATLADDGSAPVANIYVGRYEARSVPIGDTNPNGGFPGAHRFVPGRYEFFVQANGYGLTRFVEEFQPGESRTLTFSLRRNLASHHNGAVASGVADSDADLLELIDDTESTNWQSTDAALAEGKAEGEFVEGRAVTVRLSERATVSDVQVSAFLTPDGQNRFTALRSFDIAACDAQRADCTQDAAFTTVYRSPDDAFEGGFLRPKAPRLQLKSFDIPDTLATHLRLIVRDSQCTGAPQYQGEAHPSGDPTNDPDCDTGMNLQLTLLGLPEFSSNVPNEIRISEFQAFGSPASGRSEPETGARSGLITRGGSLGWMLLILLPLLARRRA